MQTLPLYLAIAQAIAAMQACAPEWHERWERQLKAIETDLLPSGSGLDVGCCIDRDASTSEKLVIVSSVHLMDEHGFYAGWQDFRVIVRPAFEGIRLTVQRIGTGNRRLWSAWVDDLCETFHAALTQDVLWDDARVRFAPVANQSAA